MKKLTTLLLFLWLVLCFSDWAVVFGHEHYLIVGRIIRFYIILFSLSVTFFYGLAKPNRFPFTYILIPIAVICFLYIFTGVIFKESAYEYAKLLFWTSQAIALYLLARHGILTLSQFAKAYSYVIWVATSATILYAVAKPDLFADEYNASAYLLTFSLPGIFLNNKKITQNWPTKIVALLGIFITLKKGALLCTAAGFLSYIFIYNIQYFSFKKLACSLLILIFGIMVAGVAIFSQSERLEGRFSAKSLDRSIGGREGMYSFLYRRWQNADRFTYVFGYGDRAETWLWGPMRRTVAHSDIYGRLHNNGLVGVAMILALHLGFFLTYWKLRQTPFASSAIMAWAIFFGVSVFSGTFYNPNSSFLYNSLAVGCGIVNWEKESLLAKINSK